MIKRVVNEKHTQECLIATRINKAKKISRRKRFIEISSFFLNAKRK